MRRIAVASVVVLCLHGAVAAAEPSLADRAAILAAEMRRGPASALDRYLAPDADPALRRLAIRALGRIGDAGGAPERLARLLDAGGADLAVVLRAAGTAQTPALVGPLAKHLASPDTAIVAAAASALGWTGDAAFADRLAGLLERKEPVVRAAALEALAHLKAAAHLEKALATIDDADRGVRGEAEFACWILARARADATTKAGGTWDGAPELARRLLPLLKADEPERRMGGVRPLGALLPKVVAKDGPFAAVFATLDDPDPRVVQDAVWRLFTKREGPDVDAALAKALDHADAKVRHLAAEALGAHGSETAKAALASRFGRETDARLREVLAVELARVGDESAWERLQGRDDRPDDEALRAATHVRVLLATRRPDALKDLLAWAKPEEVGGAIPAPAWAELLGGVEEREDPAVAVAVGQILAWPVKAGGKPVEPYVVAAALSIVEKQKLAEHLEALLAVRGERPVLEAAAKALGAIGRLETTLPDDEVRIRTRLGEMFQDPSGAVRRAAREAGVFMGMETISPKDPSRPNDWVGLPRPKGPVLGVDLAGEGAWLKEDEILRLADAIRAQRPRIVFQTTQGPFSVEVDAEQAPVQSAGLVLAVARGVYDGTRWHRVVPNFVIQGGDPYGHGAGDAGYLLPDEITDLRFVRGALGMPKEDARDTGGCQLFFMHSSYRPLDGRYTCYGTVVSGMDAVDAIRVGDRITTAKIEVPAASK